MRPALLFLVIIAFTVSCNITYTGKFNPVSPPRNPAASLPEKTFESFWQTFEDQYAFFELHNVNWHASYDQYRPKVNAQTSDDSLFSILCTMIKPLQDEHVTIIFPRPTVLANLLNPARECTSPKPSRFLQEFPTKELREKFWTMVDQSLVKNGFDPVKTIGPKEDGEPLFHYTRSPTIGYIRFTRCNASLKTEDDPKLDAEVGMKVFDNILEELNDTERIILDIRLNEGGNDEFSFALAGRFTDKKVPGLIKQSRTGGYEEFGSPANWNIEPQGKPYTKPVFVFTNDQSCSAADVFPLLMKALPQTRIVGEPSMGIFSDMYGFQLPNGWFASLSNERYSSPDMQCYEGKGVPVDVEIKNTRNDLVTLDDPVLDYVLKNSKQKD